MRQSPLKKKQLTKYLLKARNELLSEAFRGVVYGTKMQILTRKLKDVALKYVADPIYESLTRNTDEVEEAVSEIDGDSPYELIIALLPSVMSITRVMQFKARAYTDKEEKAKVSFEYLKRAKPERKLASIIRSIMNKLEESTKQKVINNSLKENVFFLVSKHEDSAKDHEPYQGRIYVNKNWRDMVKDRETKKAINIYIRKNRILDFQWVTNNPVYMITRPNCRHYFVELPIEEVLKYPSDLLLVRHDMIEANGERGLRQTATRYRGNVEFYSDRLEYLNGLYSVYPSEDIKKTITKTKFLLNRWKNSV